MVVSGEGVSGHDRDMEYWPGETVCPDKYNPDPRMESASGIQFFRTREEAEGYGL